MSSLRLLTAAPAGNNLTVTWQSVAGVHYFLERSTNLSANPHFTPLGTGIPANPAQRVSLTPTPHLWLRCSTVSV